MAYIIYDMSAMASHDQYKQLKFMIIYDNTYSPVLTNLLVILDKALDASDAAITAFN